MTLSKNRLWYNAVILQIRCDTNTTRNATVNSGCHVILLIRCNIFICSRHVLVLFEDRCTRISLYDELLFGMQLVSAMAIASALRETGVKTARIILLVR